MARARGVVAGCFHGSGPLEQLLLCVAVEGDHLGHGGFAFGESARFVDGDGPQAGRGFQRQAAFDQDSVAGRGGQAGHRC